MSDGKKQRILIVNKFLYPNGGSETYIFELGKALKKLGCEVMFFGMEDERNIEGNAYGIATSPMDFHKGGLSKLAYPFRILYSKEAAKKITMILDRFRPDIVHLNNFNFQLTPSVIIAVRKWEKRTGSKVKILYTAHDYQLICPNHMLRCLRTGKNCEACIRKGYGNCIKGRCIHGSLIRSILGAAEGKLYRMKHTYRSIDTVICPTGFMKEKLDLHPDLRGRTVFLQNFTTIEKAKEADPEKEPYVIYFGRYSEEKGIKTLLNVCRRLPEITFFFAGTGPLSEEVRSVPNIRKLGFLSQEELRPYVEKALFSVYPSEWYENCPFSVMEALMYGTPVLGSRIGGIPELVREGTDGELFESGNEEELFRKMKDLWEDRERLSLYAKNAKEAGFRSVSEYAEKLLELIGSDDAD